jgi:YVTN family beta-propeller protein
MGGLMGYSLGVDLGTTFTAAAVARADRIEMVTLGDRTVVTPSVVYVHEDGVLVTGDAAARRSVAGLHRIAREFKRRLGDPTPLMLGGTPYSAGSLLACVLRDVVRKVIDTEGESPTSVVLTHPANWGPYRRELFEEVPRLGGLDQVRTVTEPEAAAAYYAAERRLCDGDVVAVYDLGGGTFDAAVVRKRPHGTEILGSPEGIERLGGVDFDEAVLAHVDHVLGGAIAELDPRDSLDATALRRLRQDCVEAKETLSMDSEATIPVFLPNRHGEVRLSQIQFEEMVRAPIESTIEALRRAVRSAHVEPADLAAVVLVGGSSRIPLVARMVSDKLGRPTAVDTHPKYAVALGAAALAAAQTLPNGATGVAVPSQAATTDSGRDGVEHSAQTHVAPMISALTATEAAPPDAPAARAPPALSASESVDAISDTSIAGVDAMRSNGLEPDHVVSPGGGAAGTPPPPLSRRRAPFAGQPRHRKTALLSTAGGTFIVVIAVLLALNADHVGSRGPSALAPAAPAPSLSVPGHQHGPVVAPTTPAASLDTPVVSATIGTPGPQGLAIFPDAKHMYVTSVGASRLSLIDTASGTATASLYLPQPPQYVAIAPDGRHAYVSCFETNGPNTVVPVLYTASNSVTANVPVGQHPYALAVTPDGHQVFVPDHNSAQLEVINTATNALIATIPVKPNPHWVAFTPDGRTAYVSDHESNVVSVIDTTTRAVTTTVPVPTSPHSVAVSPDGRNVMVTSYDADSTSVIDTTSNRVTATIGVGKNPRSVAFAPDGQHAYVVNEGSDSASVINTRSNQVTAAVSVGKAPVVVAVTPDGRLAYVTNANSNSISVLTTAN